MTKHIPDYATVSEQPVIVPVAVLRARTEHLERLVHADRHSCVTPEEVARWVVRARGVAAELQGNVSRRATAADWQRRESALDASASAILRIICP